MLVPFVADCIEAPGPIRPRHLVRQLVTDEPIERPIQSDAVMNHAARVERRGDFVVADRPSGIGQYRQHRSACTGHSAAAGGDLAGRISTGLGHGWSGEA